MNISKLILFLGLSLSSSLLAKTLIISDIDDTIKRTNVLGKRIFINGAKTTNPFMGLNDLYNALICHDLSGTKYSDCISSQGLGHSEDIQLFYVTGAPSILQTFGRRFIGNSDFPLTTVFGKEGFTDSTLTFKVERISEIIESQTDIKDIILLGDNGEYDPLAYETIKEKYPQYNFTVYIHTLYSITEGDAKIFDEIGNPIYPGQIPYLTAVDLGIDLLAKSFIKKSDFARVFTEALIISQSRNEDIFEELIPEWMSCRYFFDIYERPSAPLSISQRLLLKKFDANVEELCNYED